MSESHVKHLPTLAKHVDQIGYTFIEPEASLRRTGERADLWGMALRPIAQAFAEHPYTNRGKAWVDLDPGASAVFEFKASVADLRADDRKEHRKPGARALGERRFYCLREGGEVRPEHVSEDNGWGVITFSDSYYSIVRPSMFFPCLYRDEKAMLYQLVKKRYSSNTFNQAQAATPPNEPAPPLKEIRIPAHIVDVISYLKGGPASTGDLCRYLREQKGKDISAGKLTRDLSKQKNLYQNGAGGNWDLREGA